MEAKHAVPRNIPKSSSVRANRSPQKKPVGHDGTREYFVPEHSLYGSHATKGGHSVVSSSLFAEQDNTYGDVYQWASPVDLISTPINTPTDRLSELRTSQSQWGDPPNSCSVVSDERENKDDPNRDYLKRVSSSRDDQKLFTHDSPVVLPNISDWPQNFFYSVSPPSMQPMPFVSSSVLLPGQSCNFVSVEGMCSPPCLPSSAPSKADEGQPSPPITWVQMFSQSSSENIGSNVGSPVFAFVNGPMGSTSPFTLTSQNSLASLNYFLPTANQTNPPQAMSQSEPAIDRSDLARPNSMSSSFQSLTLPAGVISNFECQTSTVLAKTTNDAKMVDNVQMSGQLQVPQFGGSYFIQGHLSQGSPIFSPQMQTFTTPPTRIITSPVLTSASTIFDAPSYTPLMGPQRTETFLESNCQVTSPLLSSSYEVNPILHFWPAPPHSSSS